MSAAPTKQSGLRALIVDASVTDTRLMEIFLKKHFVHIATDHHGQTAVKCVVNAARDGLEFDVIIINQNIAGMSGIEATKLFRQSGFKNSIIGTSSELPASLKEQWKSAGCDHFLPKPISADALIEAITLAFEAKLTPQGRVLLHESDATIRNWLQFVIERQGHQVAVCESMQEALLWFESPSPAIDLIVTEVSSQKIESWQFWQSLLPAYPTIESLYLGVHPIEKYHQKSMTIAMDRFLQKPFDMALFLNKVEELIFRTNGSS